MSDEKPEREWNRRDFLEWAGAIGLTSLAPSTMAEVADAKERHFEEMDSVSEKGDPSSDVYHTHVTELPLIQRRLEKFDKSSDPREFFHESLVKHLQENPTKDSFNIIVRTLGERNRVTDNGPYERTIHGWRPTDAEVARLSDFGKVGFVPEFISTTMSLHDVARKDLTRIAALKFVVEINWDQPVELEGSSISVSDLRDVSYYDFSGASYDVKSYNEVGVIDSGYAGGGASKYSSSLASDYIDTDIANDFTSENTGWDDTDYDHGDNVMDTIQAMLKQDQANTYVPLKVLNSNTSVSEVNDNVRAAIEYAEKEYIDTINLSLGTSGPSDTCPSLFCAELDAYTMSAGYFPFASAGNDSSESGPTYPGGEYLTIGVGGIDDSGCSNKDYHRDNISNYGKVDLTNCAYCSQYASSEFCPHIYGCYHTKTDTGKILDGTSYASPQAAAAGVIMKSNDLYDYQTAVQEFKSMDWWTICPDSAAKTGQLLDAYHADKQTE